MKRINNISNQIATIENYRMAFLRASKNKTHRKDIVEFSENLDVKLMLLLTSFIEGTHHTSEFKFMTIFEPKERRLGLLPFREHVYEWAMLTIAEPVYQACWAYYVYGGVTGKGTHAYKRAIERCLKKHTELKYYLLLDIHKFYPSIDLNILKKNLAHFCKDKVLLHAFYEIIDSQHVEKGLYPGTKIAQFFALVNLCLYAHDLKSLFSIKDNPVLVNYYFQRYVSLRILTAKEADREDLDKGISYLREKFEKMLQRLDYCFLFVDDVAIPLEDHVFAGFIVEWVGLYLARELHLELNPKWHIDLISKGMCTGGYQFFGTHTRVRKRNKQALCRQVATMRHKGYNDKEILLHCSSRIGFCGHANTHRLFEKLGIMRLGEKIKQKRTPWTDLDASHYKRFSEIVSTGDEEKEINLLDFKIIDSKISKEQKMVDNEIKVVPKKCLAIRYKIGNEEFYSFTGSNVLIDQSENDFSKEDLPCDTVIKETVNRLNKKFYKFT